MDLVHPLVIVGGAAGLYSAQNLLPVLLQKERIDVLGLGRCLGIRQAGIQRHCCFFAAFLADFQAFGKAAALDGNLSLTVSIGTVSSHFQGEGHLVGLLVKGAVHYAHPVRFGAHGRALRRGDGDGEIAAGALCADALYAQGDGRGSLRGGFTTIAIVFLAAPGQSNQGHSYHR